MLRKRGKWTSLSHFLSADDDSCGKKTEEKDEVDVADNEMRTRDDAVHCLPEWEPDALNILLIIVFFTYV